MPTSKRARAASRKHFVYSRAGIGVGELSRDLDKSKGGKNPARAAELVADAFNLLKRPRGYRPVEAPHGVADFFFFFSPTDQRLIANTERKAPKASKRWATKSVPISRSHELWRNDPPVPANIGRFRARPKQERLFAQGLMAED
jgi:hypothetical protein